MDLSASSKVLVQGIAGVLGNLYTARMRAYGTSIVAGVSPGHGGQVLEDVPVFDLVEQAMTAVGPVDATVILVEPYRMLDAALEAIAAGIRHLVLVTEGVPPLDMVKLLHIAERTETLVVGPDSPGIILPGKVLLGTYPAELYSPGRIGLISRSGTLTHEIALHLTQAGLGQSIAAGIGGDRIVGSSFQQWLQILDEDDQTEAIVLVGEIGGNSEEEAARYIVEAIDKPVIAYIAGRTAPKNHRMGHAGAIIASLVSGWGSEIGTPDSKVTAFQKAGVPVADRPSDIPALLKQALRI